MTGQNDHKPLEIDEIQRRVPSQDNNEGFCYCASTDGNKMVDNDLVCATSASAKIPSKRIPTSQSDKNSGVPSGEDINIPVLTINGEDAVSMVRNKTCVTGQVEDIETEDSSKEEQYQNNSTEDFRSSGDADEINQNESREPSVNGESVTRPKFTNLFRRRNRKVSMFEVQPKGGLEVIQIQDICIEKGSVQAVKESGTTLPEIAVSSKVPPTREMPDSHDRSRLVTHASNLPQHSSKKLYDRQLRHTKSSPDSSRAEVTDVHSCPGTPFSSPQIRRRSLGFVTTPAWGVTMYRDQNTPDEKPRSPRRRFMVTPRVGNWCTDQKQDPLENKRSSDEQERRLSLPWNEHILIREKRQNKEGEDQKQPAKCGMVVMEQMTEERNNEGFDEEDVEFRPRLRSLSLDDYRVAARQKVVKVQEVSKHNSTRRKSFEAWLSDKEKETIEKMNLLALEKQREAEELAKRRQQRKGKNYEEWLKEKSREGTKKHSGLDTGNEAQLESEKRHRTAQARYEKWLFEKEMQALRKEEEMLKEAERKTIEMRKKYEERKKNAMNGLKYSRGSVCG